MSEPHYCLDEDLIPGSRFTRGVGYLNSGRQLVRNRAGHWFMAWCASRWASEPNVLVLAAADRADMLGEAISVRVELVGQARRGLQPLFVADEPLGNVCLLMGAADRLHVLYDLGGRIYVRVADASAADATLREAPRWSEPRLVAEGCLGDAVLTGDSEGIVLVVRGGNLYEAPLTAPGRETLLAEQAIHPSAHLDAQGVLHLAFERDCRIFYVQRGGQPELVAHYCCSWPSIVVSDQGQIIIAYQGEGKVDLGANAENYVSRRASAGTTVSYALRRDGRWSNHDLLRSSEIVLKRRPHHRKPQRPARMYAHLEEFWRPSLSIDHHGVVWMFWVNTTRRHVYWSRFLGQSFGEHHEARGPYDALSRTVLVQKDTRGHAAIGYLTFACEQMYFDAIPVPDYHSDQPRRVVFLDNLEVDTAVDLEHRVGVWQRHPQRIFGWGVSGTAPEDHVSFCQVYPRGDGYEMHYGAFGKLRITPLLGRAVSQDGLHWQKQAPAELGEQTLDGRAFPDSFWRPVYLEDPQEPDPARRYKGLVGAYRYEAAIELRYYDVVASPDAHHWRRVPDLPPVATGDGAVQLLRDDEDPDPRRRYKFLAVSGCAAGRAVVVFTSPDLIHWDRPCWLREDPNEIESALCAYPTGPIAIDPDAGESPKEEEVHHACMWREQGLLMFHYDAFDFGQNQHVEKALALSRDGRHYWRVKRGACNLPHGACGAWDSGRVRTSVPIRVGDELRLYYNGMPASGKSAVDADEAQRRQVRPMSEADYRQSELRPWSVSMAKLRVDGWACFQLARDAARGELTTIPFRYRAGTLVVNGTGLGQGLHVEIMTAERQPVAGFGAQEARFSAVDAVDGTVAFTGGRLAPGTYRLRFTFDDLRARLYAFGFKPEA